MVAVFIILLAIAIVVTVIIVYSKLYVKTPPNMAFVRTGLGGRRVVIDRGAIVLPFVQDVQWISLETFKLEVFKANKEAFITKDRFRVDIGADFYVKVQPTEEAVERASRSLGERALSAEGLKSLLEEKFISALRSESAKRTLVDLHEDRRAFAKAVKEALVEALEPNGLMLEEVSIFYLDQTDKKFLDPNNVFDAEGLRQITLQTSERLRERNEIERNTEVAIKKKDVEAIKLKLTLDQERAFAEAEQRRQVEIDRAKKLAETEKFKFEQERLIREAEIQKEKLIREAEIAKETYLIEQEKMKQLKEIEKRQALEEADILREKALILKEVEKLQQEIEKLKTDAERHAAEEKVKTALEKVKAEREKEIALIGALKELEVAEKKLQSTELLANARKIEGEAEAYAREKLFKAENVLDEKIITRDILLQLIGRSPEILKEMMSPVQKIGDMKVLHIDGLGGSTDSGSTVEGVIGAILKSGTALPLLREIIKMSKIDLEGLKKTVQMDTQK